MERILYIEGSSGISGDMTVSALLDLGASRRYMEEQIEKLPLEGYRLLVGRTTKNGIEACAFYVELDETKPSLIGTMITFGKCFFRRNWMQVYGSFLFVFLQY